MRTDFVLDALEQALYARQLEQGSSLIQHSDRGSQCVSIRYTERSAEAGIEPSLGSKGDSYDNALAETINALYKAELIHRRAPWRTKEAVELPRWSGYRGSTTIACLNPSGTSRLQKLRQTTTGNSPIRPLSKWADLNQTASAETGAIQRLAGVMLFDVAIAPLLHIPLASSAQCETRVADRPALSSYMQPRGLRFSSMVMRRPGGLDHLYQLSVAQWKT